MLNLTSCSSSDLADLTSSSESHVKFGLLNARSVKNKVVNICDSISSKNISVCAITETWMNADDDAILKEFFDMGYNILHEPRASGRGGGVGVWFKRGLDVRKVKTCFFNSFELTEVMLTCHCEKYSISTFYRTGALDLSCRESFLKDIEDYVATKTLSQERVVLMGDFNIHVEDTNDVLAVDFIDLMKSMGFHQIVSSPTHVKGGTLDLIFVQDLTLVQNLIIYNDSNDAVLSDHFLIELSIRSVPKWKVERLQQTFRSLSNMDVDQFSEELKKNLCSTAGLTLEKQVELLFSTTRSLLDKHAPLQHKSFIVSNKPFTDVAINDAKKLKRRAERRYRKSCLDNDKHDLHVATRNLSKIVKTQYNEFYSNKLQAVRGDAKGTYNIINHLLNKGKKRVLPDYSEPVTLANKFETFFLDRIQNICSSMNYSLGEPQVNTTTALFTEFALISSSDLDEMLKSVKIKYSLVDEIPTKLINPIIKSSFPTILKIVNDSLQGGNFPDHWKKAFVTPVLKSKKQDVNDVSNYRPLSDISIFSKVLEKCAYVQLYDHLEENNLLIVNQSAYKKHHSCETALLKICNDVLKTLDSSTNVIVVLLDFSAAFDTINHELLLKKLHNQYGIRGTALRWFKSYLDGRLLKVKIQHCVSKGRSLNYGVPQGSVLGPLLFSLYAQEIHQIISRYGLRYHIFADDIQIYSPLTSGFPELNTLKDCLNEIKLWTSKNSLKLNESKTKFVEIKTRHSNIRLNNFTVLDKIFKCDPYAKNLGVLIDEKLCFSNQINEVCRMGFVNIRQLWRLSSKLKSITLKIQLVHSCILSKIDYCNSLYFNLPGKQIKKLQRLLNAAVRFIFNIRRRKFPATLYLKKAHILPVELRLRFKMCVMVFKCFNGIAPPYLQNLIRKKISLESLRVSQDTTLLDEPRLEQHFKNRRFEIVGPRQWNMLPRFIRETASVELFKSRLKTFLFNKF